MLRNIEDIIQRIFLWGKILRTPPTLQLYFRTKMADKMILL